MNERQRSAIISRRELLRLSAISAAAVGLAACVPSTTGQATTAPSPTLQARRGGVLTWAQWDANAAIDPDSMEPDYNTHVTIERLD